MIYIIAASGLSCVYLIVMSLVIQTKNIPSALTFKVIPFFIGLLNLLVFLKAWGIV
jgi:hypothetical protein